MEQLGSLADLDDHIAQLQQGGPENFPKYLRLLYYRAQLKGEGKLDPLMNDRYPAIQPTTVEQWPGP